MMTVITTSPKIKSEALSGSTKKIQGKIEFRNVYFKYPTRNEWVLKDISFVVNPSESAAIVGTSGSGKSTLILLLERFYEITSGQILIDDIDIKEYNLTHLRKSMSYVSQEPVLFDSTIEDNIKYGKREATEEEVKQAAIISCAMPFIEKDIEK